MRTQIAAANWKMNLTYQQGEHLLDEILDAGIELKDHQKTLFAVPFPYLTMTRSEVSDLKNYYAAAQNCHHEKSGAYTGEVSAEMIHSLSITYCIIGHSERREYNSEHDQMLAEKVNRCFENFITPVFCCGEPLEVRQAGSQNQFVAQQIGNSLFHLPDDKIRELVIAYEPIWAIGTGVTASTEQAQEMHAHIRSVIAGKYGKETADVVPILYGGSVKASNAGELFACPDVDGGLVGGASLKSSEFIEIIRSLK